MLIPSTKALICCIDLAKIAIENEYSIFGALVNLNEEKRRDDLYK